jgi:hypothetical protein
MTFRPLHDRIWVRRIEVGKEIGGEIIPRLHRPGLLKQPRGGSFVREKHLPWIR